MSADGPVDPRPAQPDVPSAKVAGSPSTPGATSPRAASASTPAASSSVPAPLAMAAPVRRRRVSWWRGPMTTNTTTALVAAACFVVLAALIALAPVPFVSWGPGRTVDLAAKNDQGQPMVQVEGLPATSLNGQLRMTTVSVTRVDSQLSLPEAVLAYWLPSRDVLPREFVYPKSKTTEQVKAEEVAMMGDSQREAVVAALRAAGQPVEEYPMITSVVVSGPSNGKLQPGDLIRRVDDTAVQTVDDVRQAITAHKVGESVVFSVERNGTEVDVTVETAPGPKEKAVPYIGVQIGVGHKHNAVVKYGIDPAIVGPSAGLVFALAIYDQITENDLLQGLKVAGTGTISADGTVGPIGGIQEKIAGAEKAGAQVFLVPAANCTDIQGVKTSMSLVKVENLREAISSLQKINQNKGEGVPRC